MSARIVLLSLPVRVGKTTFLREWAQRQPPGSVGPSRSVSRNG